MMETSQYETEYSTLYNMNNGRETLKRKMTLDLNFPSSQGAEDSLQQQQASVIKKARVIAASIHTPIYSEGLGTLDFKNVPSTPDLDYAMKSVGLYSDNHFSESTSLGKQQQQNGYVQNGVVTSYGLHPIPTTTYATTVVSQYNTNGNTNSGSSGDSDDNSYSDNSMTSSTNSTYTTNGQYPRPPEYTNMQTYSANNSGVHVKEEPTPHSPIDMANQEKIKLERKRMRNRLAASKCRKRKLEKISKLEEKVNQLKKENGELNGVREKLNESVRMLKEQVMRHAEAGCQIMVSTATLNSFNWSAEIELNPV